MIFFLTVYLNFIGLETDKFDTLIKDKANAVNKNIKLDFNKTKIYFDIKNLKLIVKLQNPKVLLKENNINLLKLHLFLSIKSFYNQNFILEKAAIGFEKNDIKDLTKITNIFLPQFINKQLQKVFAKGSLEGNFNIPFSTDGKVGKNYTFSGQIIGADILLSKDYKIKNLNASIGYQKSDEVEKDGLKIIINKGMLLNLELLKSFIDIKFKNNNKLINASIHTKGNLNFLQIKKISSLLQKKVNYFSNIDLTSDLTTNIEFQIDKNLRFTNKKYSIKGNIDKLLISIDDKKIIKKFMPSFNHKIDFKNTKIDFSAPKGLSGDQVLNLDGNINLSDKFETIKLKQIYNNGNKKYTINGSSSLTSSSLNIPSLNYIKKVGSSANLTFNTNFIFDNFLLLENITYEENKSKINLKNIKLNKNLELDDFELLSVKTYSNNIENNNYKIERKKNELVISGKVFDAQPLFKTLYNKNEKKTFSKKFNSEVKVNFKKTITGTNDNILNLSMIATIRKGSYDKLSLKGNFSKKEIIEMTIYQVNNDTKTLHVISDRARPFIKHFDFIKGFEGGKLEYESIIEKTQTNSNLLITDFKVAKVPALAKLLTLASLQGIADTLNGEGIRFESFEMKLNSKKNVIKIEDALAMGPAISILLDGYIEKKKLVSLKGTLVPATKLNAIIASIPIIGDILVGKKSGEGVVGVSFKMKGPPKNIKTTVNPIKTLTPRFIIRALEKRKKNRNN